MKKIILTILFGCLSFAYPNLALAEDMPLSDVVINECTTDLQCPPTSFCLPKTVTSGSTCLSKRGSSVTCTRNEECKSNNCQGAEGTKTCVDPSTGAGAFKVQFVAPTLEINIPTLKPFTTSGIQLPDAAGYVYFPFLGQYVEAIFRWMLLVAGTVAVVIMMVGGFIYMTAGGNKQRVDEGKHRFTHALFGLLLLLGSYTILYIINPGLVEFRSLKIKVLEREELKIVAWTDQNAAGLDLPAGNKFCGCVNFRETVNTSKLKDGAAISTKIKELKSTSPLSAYGSTIIEDAKKYNLDPMLALAIWRVDSGLGTAGAGATNKNPGNIICKGAGKTGPTYTCDNSSHHFRVYQKWEDAIHDWFATTDATNGWTMWKNSKNVKQLLNYYAPPSDNNNTPRYIDMVTDLLIKENTATINDLKSSGCSC